MRSYKDLNIDYKGGDLDISFDRLELLTGCPEVILGDFTCNDNKLKTFVGGPHIVSGNYNCEDNHLTDLVGCASHIDGALFMQYNDITSLVGIHKIIKSCEVIEFGENRITDGGIGLLLIENLIDISSNIPPFEIIKRYLGSGTKGMMACRKELIKAGYTNHAKL